MSWADIQRWEDGRGPEPLAFDGSDIEPDTDLEAVFEASARDAASRAASWQRRAEIAEAAEAAQERRAEAAEEQLAQLRAQLAEREGRDA